MHASIPQTEDHRLILIMAKTPYPGAVKTRLCPPLTPGLAADLYRAFLRDTLATACTLPNTTIGVVYPLTADDRPLRALLPPGALLWPQEAGGLDVGLSGAFARGFAAGYQRIVVLSSDSPTVPAVVLEEAFSMLDTYGVTLGPTHDGGYYLIGLDQPRPRLFEAITWSTAAVYSETLARAAETGLRVHATSLWHDVDTVEDLAALAADCAQGAAPHTAEMLGNAALRRLIAEAGLNLPPTGAPNDASEARSWRTVSSETVLETPWRTFRSDRALLHTGDEITYNYVATPAAVWIVPLLADGRIALIHQYRYPVRRWVWEVPAGAIGDEAPVEAARRELTEEIGGRCRDLRPVGRFYSSSAHLTLDAHVYLALDVELAQSAREATELLDLVVIPADEAFARARSGAIDEGQSALALLMCEPLVRTWLERLT